MLSLSTNQIAWLETRGGRGLSDILAFNKKLGVLMGGKNKTDKFVPLPKSESIKYRLSNRGYILMK